MTVSVSGHVRVFLLTGVLVLLPMQVSSSGMNYDEALANNAGGNGKGQGQSRAGSNGGSGGTAAGVGGTAGAASNRGRFNSLNDVPTRTRRPKAFTEALGAMAQYAAALSAFNTIDPTDDPTAEELAAILAKVANKEELVPETIDWIHQILLSKGMVTQTTLDEAASILALPIDPNADPNGGATGTPTLAELLAEQANLMQESESNQGLGQPDLLIQRK